MCVCVCVCGGGGGGGGVQSKIKNRMANSVDPDDETAHYESSHLDLYCLHRCLFWTARLKDLTG